MSLVIIEDAAFMPWRGNDPASTDSEFLPKTIFLSMHRTAHTQKEHEGTYREGINIIPDSTFKLHWPDPSSLSGALIYFQSALAALNRSDIKEEGLLYRGYGGYVGDVAYDMFRKPLEDRVWLWKGKYVESSAVYQELPEDFYQKIETLFELAKEQIFEDGMESEFSKELVSLVKKHGHAAMMALTSLIVDEKVNSEVASEALRWLGRMNHPQTYRDRLWLLERCLFCSSARVRDGAVLGLASLDDLHAIDYLKQAIQKELCAELREDMEQVLKQLENR